VQLVKPVVLSGISHQPVFVAPEDVLVAFANIIHGSCEQGVGFVALNLGFVYGVAFAIGK